MTDLTPILAYEDPDDPGHLYFNRCPLCGVAAAEHTEQVCEDRLAAAPGPVGLLDLGDHSGR